MQQPTAPIDEFLASELLFCASAIRPILQFRNGAACTPPIDGKIPRYQHGRSEPFLTIF